MMETVATEVDPVAAQWLDLLRSELERQGVSMRELARRLGLSQPTVQERLASPSPVTSEVMHRYFDALGLSLGLVVTKGADEKIG